MLRPKFEDFEVFLLLQLESAIQKLDCFLDFAVSQKFREPVQIKFYCYLQFLLVD